MSKEKKIFKKKKILRKWIYPADYFNIYIRVIVEISMLQHEDIIVSRYAGIGRRHACMFVRKLAQNIPRTEMLHTHAQMDSVNDMSHWL